MGSRGGCGHVRSSFILLFLALVHSLLLQHRSTGYSPSRGVPKPAWVTGGQHPSGWYFFWHGAPPSNTVSLAVSPAMSPSTSPASYGCCCVLNTCEQMCHRLLKLAEVLAHTGVFTPISKLAGSSCEWHRAVPDLLSYNLTPVPKTWQFMPSTVIPGFSILETTVGKALLKKETLSIYLQFKCNWFGIWVFKNIRKGSFSGSFSDSQKSQKNSRH